MDKIIRYMLAEDEGFGDVTSNAVVDKDKTITASIVSKDEGILAGIDIISEVFEDYGIQILSSIGDGSRIGKGDLIMSVRGNARTILLLERTVLNLSMRMSGVATAANHYVELVKGSNVRIAGTRKTSPGIAKFDKMALAIGGADTHRFSLDDMILIKDNHIASCGTPLETLKKAQDNASFSKKIEIEVETLSDAVDCVSQGADIVMLDNMSGDEVGKVIDELTKLGIRENSLIEVSGGITEENIADYVDLGVDIISLGALTHSSRSLNFSMRFGE